MNKLKVSIIIPIYNVEKYLRKCLDSIVSQTYTNLEILLIDDGSTDSSGKMCDDFSLKDKRIKVIHKKNGGLSDARNVGIDNSTGDYIFCLDSDDIVELNCIEKLLEIQQKYSADIVQCDFNICDENDIYTQKTHTKYFEKEFNKKEQMMSLLKNTEIKTMAWGKLYKKELFMGIRYELGKYHEDTFTTYKLLDSSNKTIVISDKLYIYRQVSTSITHSKFSRKHLDGIEATIKREKFIKKKYPMLDGYAKATICHTSCKCLEKIYTSNCTKITNKEILNYIKVNIRANIMCLIKYSNCSFKTKIFAIISSVSIKLCNIAYRIFR